METAGLNPYQLHMPHSDLRARFLKVSDEATFRALLDDLEDAHMGQTPRPPASQGQDDPARRGEVAAEEHENPHQLTS